MDQAVYSGSAIQDLAYGMRKTVMIVGRDHPVIAMHIGRGVGDKKALPGELQQTDIVIIISYSK